MGRLFSGFTCSGHFALNSTRASLSLFSLLAHHTTLYHSPLGAPSDRILGIVLECELTGGETREWRALAVASFVKWDPELSHLALNQERSINLSHASDCQLFHRGFFFPLDVLIRHLRQVLRSLPTSQPPHCERMSHYGDTNEIFMRLAAALLSEVGSCCPCSCLWPVTPHRSLSAPGRSCH